MLDSRRDRRRKRRWRRRRFRGVVVAPQPTTAGRAGTDSGTDGARAQRHHVHARAALQQGRETDAREHGPDQTAGRRHVPVAAEQRRRPRKVDRCHNEHRVGRRMMT